MIKRSQTYWLLPAIAGVFLLAAVLRAQDESMRVIVHDKGGPEAKGLETSGPAVTVHGLVVNAATGEGLSRALVKMGNRRELGALTDSEGRFSIPGVAPGLEAVTVTKPGFATAGEAGDSADGALRLVRIDKDTPELRLELHPFNTITGRVTLSTGVPGANIKVYLLRRVITNGRAGWSYVLNEQTGPAGRIRFLGLADGEYLLMSGPVFENLDAYQPVCNAQSPLDVPGYAPTYYGGAQDASGAATIPVRNGQTAEANLSLNLSQFHLVQIAMQNVPGAGSWSFDHILTDRAGQRVLSPTREEKDHTLCGYLPDGNYSVTVFASPDSELPMHTENLPQPGGPATNLLAGMVDFAVEGHAEPGLRVPLGPAVETPVYLHYQPGPLKMKNPPTGEANEESQESTEPIDIAASPVNGAPRGQQVEAYSTRMSGSTYGIVAGMPGQYWIGASSRMSGECLGEVTSAGQDLALHPWVAGQTGAGTPIDVVLRTDCAKLTVEMAAGLAAESAGKGTIYYIYAVPAFPSLESPFEARLEQYAESSVTIKDVTPGRYRVFAFRSPHTIEYRNPEAMKALGGQEITLEPNAGATLVIEEAAP